MHTYIHMHHNIHTYSHAITTYRIHVLTDKHIPVHKHVHMVIRMYRLYVRTYVVQMYVSKYVRMHVHMYNV